MPQLCYNYTDTLGSEILIPFVDLQYSYVLSQPVCFETKHNILDNDFDVLYLDVSIDGDVT